jgi:M6 family metalloprotease-like protein
MRGSDMRRDIKALTLALAAGALVVATAGASPVSRTAVGEQRILVIMARFPDVDPSFSRAQMREKYFVKLDRYLRAISHGKAWIAGEMTDWYTLPNRADHYRLSRHNLQVERERVMGLIQDAVDRADEDEDFIRYSMIFVSLGAKQTDYGMMGLCGYPGMLGWQSDLPVRTRKRGQEIPGGVAIYCENAHVGVVFHDMAHIMGGVQHGHRVMPCLYDHDLQAQRGAFRNHYTFYLTNVGFFDPMSCHFYRLKQGPPGVCAWTKLRFGWVEPQKIVEVPRGARKTVSLGPLSSGQSSVQVVKLPIDPTTYYLIENRQPVGPDKNLPAWGVLVYSCDDGVAECRHGGSPVKLIDAEPSVPELRGAPFKPEGTDTYRNAKHGVVVDVVARTGDEYTVRVSNGT